MLYLVLVKQLNEKWYLGTRLTPVLDSQFHMLFSELVGGLFHLYLIFLLKNTMTELQICFPTVTEYCMLHPKWAGRGSSKEGGSGGSQGTAAGPPLGTYLSSKCR